MSIKYTKVIKDKLYFSYYSQLITVDKENDKNAKGTFAGVTIILSEWKIKIR
jgi:hypothetical protein